MEVISIESSAFAEIMQKITKIAEKENSKESRKEWLDGADVCQKLKISKRTLQHYRDTGVISYSNIGGKILFRDSDIEEHLQRNYRKAYRDID